jgi:circadian clock protein KaiB
MEFTKNIDDGGMEQTPASNLPWKLRLYVNGKTSLRSIITLQNLTDLCEKYLPNSYELEIVDLLDDVERANDDNIMALPTLVRRSPPPVRKIIGNLSNTSQVITSLGLPANPYDL